MEAWELTWKKRERKSCFLSLFFLPWNVKNVLLQMAMTCEAAAHKARRRCAGVLLYHSAVQEKYLSRVSRFAVQRTEILHSSVWKTCPVQFFNWSRIRQVQCKRSLNLREDTSWRRFWKIRHRNLLKCVPHVRHDYFSSFSQSDHWFMTLP